MVDWSGLPAVVGLPYREALEAPGRERQVWGLLQTAYNALRLSSVVLLADYVDTGRVDPRIARHLAGLRRPCFSTWYALTSALVKRRRSRLESVAQAWLALCGDTDGVTLGLPRINVHEPTNPLTSAWALRNLLGHGGMLDESLLRVAGERLPKVLEALLDHLRPLWSLRLQGEVMGDAPRFLIEDRAVPAGPLVRLTANASDPFLILDGYGRTGVTMLGAQGRSDHPDLVESLYALLREQRVPATARRADSDAASVLESARSRAAVTIDAVAGSGFDRATHVDRLCARELRSALTSPGRAILISGPAGSGKSSLLYDLTDELLERGDPVILLRGGVDFRAEGSVTRQLVAVMAEALGLDGADYGSVRDLLGHVDRLWEQWERPPRLVIAVDAVDEAPLVRPLLAALDNVAPLLREMPFLRVVVTIRRGAWDAVVRGHKLLQRPGAGPLTNLAGWLAPVQTEGAPPGISVGAFSTGEARVAYETRRGVLPPADSVPGWDLLPAEVRRLLASPLLLDMFVQVWRGRADLPSDLDRTALFAAYLDRLVERHPGMAATLDKLGEWLAGSSSTRFAADRVTELVRKWRSRLGIAGPEGVLGLDPIEALESAGILAVDDDDWRFTHEEFAALVLYRWYGRRGLRDLRAACDEGHETSVDLPPRHVLAALRRRAADIATDADPRQLAELLDPAVRSMAFVRRKSGLWAWAYIQLIFASGIHLLFTWIAANVASSDGRFEVLWPTLRDLLHRAGTKGQDVVVRLGDASRGSFWRSLRLALAVRDAAQSLRRQGAAAAAEPALMAVLEVLASTRASCGWWRRTALARAQLLAGAELAEVRADIGDEVGARAARREAFDAIGGFHPHLGGCHAAPPLRLAVAVDLIEAGETDDAEAVIRRELDTTAAVVGALDDAPEAVDNQVLCLSILGRIAPDEARALLVELAEALCNKRSTDASVARLADKALEALADLSESTVELHRRRVEVLQASPELAKEPFWLVSALEDLAEALEGTEEVDEARATLEQAVTIRGRFSDLDDEDEHGVAQHARCLGALGKLTQDTGLLQQAISLRERVMRSDAEPDDLVFCLLDLAQAHEDRSESDQALAAWERVDRVCLAWEQRGGAQHGSLRLMQCHAMSQAVTLLASRGDREASRKLAQRAVELYRKLPAVEWGVGPAERHAACAWLIGLGEEDAVARLPAALRTVAVEGFASLRDKTGR